MTTVGHQQQTTIWIVEREANRADVGFFAESAWTTRAAAVAHVERNRASSPTGVRWSITPLVIDVDQQP